DTFVRERGAAAFAELADKSELLVDYFLSEQAGEARGSIAERARAVQRVAGMLKLVDDPFQFDLLARKAADLLSIGEEVLRKGARGPQSGAARYTSSRFARDRAATANPPAASSGDAGAKAEIGLVALALLHPELRNEIAQSGAAANFEQIRLGGVLADLCRTDEAYTALEQWIAERLSVEEQGQISEFAVGPLTDDIDDSQKNPNDPEKCRALVNDYVVALDRRRRAHELGRLRQSASEVSARESEPGEAAAAAQAVIAHRRLGQGRAPHPVIKTPARCRG